MSSSASPNSLPSRSSNPRAYATRRYSSTEKLILRPEAIQKPRHELSTSQPSSETQSPTSHVQSQGQDGLSGPQSNNRQPYLGNQSVRPDAENIESTRQMQTGTYQPSTYSVLTSTPRPNPHMPVENDGQELARKHAHSIAGHLRHAFDVAGELIENHLVDEFIRLNDGYTAATNSLSIENAELKKKLSSAIAESARYVAYANSWRSQHAHLKTRTDELASQYNDVLTLLESKNQEVESLRNRITALQKDREELVSRLPESPTPLSNVHKRKVSDLGGEYGKVPEVNLSQTTSSNREISMRPPFIQDAVSGPSNVRTTDRTSNTARSTTPLNEQRSLMLTSTSKLSPHPPPIQASDRPVIVADTEEDSREKGRKQPKRRRSDGPPTSGTRNEIVVSSTATSLRRSTRASASDKIRGSVPQQKKHTGTDTVEEGELIENNGEDRQKTRQQRKGINELTKSRDDISEEGEE